MPSEAIALWRRWTQPEHFCKVVAQAVQPSFSNAYHTGDVTGSTNDRRRGGGREVATDGFGTAGSTEPIGSEQHASVAQRSRNRVAAAQVALEALSAPPEELLEARWRRVAYRVDSAASREGGEEETPEPPEHLSRAYLSAFLRDLGRHLNNDANYASIADVQRRFPHLHQLVNFSSGEEAGNSSSSSAPT